MKIIDGNNMLHREMDQIGRGIHPVRSAFSKFTVPRETTIIVWDGAHGNQRRKDIFEGYKAKRPKRTESQYEFFNMVKAVLRYTPTILIECEGWEADDVIGTLCHKFHKDHEIRVESNDGDYWQFSEMAYLPMVSTKWHKWKPWELVLYKATVGDGKDNIPGIRGFGDKAFNRLTPAQRKLLSEAAMENDFSKFRAAVEDNWPNKVPKHIDTFEAMCLCHKLNSYWTVPDDEIDAGTFSGKLDIPAAEIFMGEFLI